MAIKNLPELEELKSRNKSVNMFFNLVKAKSDLTFDFSDFLL